MKFGADYYTCIWEITYMDFGIKKKETVEYNEMQQDEFVYFRFFQEHPRLCWQSIISVKKIDFIPFDMLRKRFQKLLLDLLLKDIGKDSFRPIKNKIYTVTFNANGGRFKDGSEVNVATISYMQELNYPSVATRDNYYFKGWDGEQEYYSYDEDKEFKVNWVNISSISVDTAPNKVNYEHLEMFDPTGLKIKLNFSDGSNTIVEYNDDTKNDFSFNPNLATALIETNTFVTITYSGKTCRQNITVLPVEVASISIVNTPNRVDYNVANKLDPTGLVIRVYYVDGTIADIIYSIDNADKFTFNPSLNVLLTKNMHEVEVTYRGKMATFEISVTSSSGGGDTPSGGGGSGSSGGGGGGNSRGSGGIINILDRSINFVVQTTIEENEYSFINDLSGRKIGILLKGNSKVGKALLLSSETKDLYQLMNNGDMQLKGGGLFKLKILGQECYYGVDSLGNIMTGFAVTSNRTAYIKVNMDSSIIKTFEQKGDKYYLYEQEGVYRGMLWNQPIVVARILYTFDSQGRVISTIDTSVGQGVWEYSPTENKWKFYTADSNGQVMYNKDGVYDILYNNEVLKFGFDKDGNMLTGVYNLNGVTYYSQENGVYAGAITNI